MSKLKLSYLFIVFIIIFSFTACNSSTSQNAQSENSTSTTEQTGDSEILYNYDNEFIGEQGEDPNITVQREINIATLKGPTGIGMAQLMEKNSNGKAKNKYNFTVAASPDDITAKIINGEIQIAAIPTNLASVLYNKTNGEIQIAAINTLGVLYIVENGETIQAIKDLGGKILYATGKGAVPEYVLDYLISKNNITDLNVEYKADHAELATLMSSGDVQLGMLPEPYVSTVLSNNKNTRIALDIQKEWDNAQGENSVPLSMGCIVVQTDFAKENPNVVADFLDEYKESTEYANNNIKDTAQLVVKHEIMPDAATVEKAIPNCNIVYIDDLEMKNSAQAFYNILLEKKPESIGGRLPKDDFYYEK